MITDVSIIEDTKLARELVEDKEAVLDILCEVDGRALEKFHSTFHLCEDEERSYVLTDILELHFIECPKFRRLPFDIRDPLHRWLRFLDQQATPEQLEELMKVDERFKKAETRLSYLASDEDTRRRYALREKALHDRASLLNDARTAGFKEGINNTALKEGLDAAFICRITGLDAAQIERLKENRMCKPETNGQEESK